MRVEGAASTSYNPVVHTKNCLMSDSIVTHQRVFREVPRFKLCDELVQQHVPTVERAIPVSVKHPKILANPNRAVSRLLELYRVSNLDSPSRGGRSDDLPRRSTISDANRPLGVAIPCIPSSLIWSPLPGTSWSYNHSF